MDRMNFWVAIAVVATTAGCASGPKVKSGAASDAKAQATSQGLPPSPLPPSEEGGPLQSLGVGIQIDRRTLSNGLTVLMVEDTSVPVISYQSWYRVGSVDEKPGSTGLAHLFEHLMFKGTEKYGPKQFFHQLEAKGAEVNAFTTRDYTVYYESFAPNLLEKVVEMEADRLQNLVLTEEALKTEVMVVFEERRLRTENSPPGRIQEALWAQAYRRHPYRWPVIGVPQDLVRIELDELREFFKTHYRPSNLVLVVTGNIDRDKTFELIRKHYGEIEGGERPIRSIPVEPEQNEERRLVLYDEVSSEHFARAYHITAADQEDSYAIDVLSNILFEGTDSRAYHKLVEETDLLAGLSGTSYTPTYPGLLMVSAILKGKRKTEEAEPVLDAVIRDVQDRGVTQAEVDKAVRQLTVQLIDSVRTPHGLAQLVGTVATIFGDPNRFSEDLKRYLKVKPADVQRVANQYLGPNNRSVVILRPEKERAK